jgi:hypothetical protein
MLKLIYDELVNLLMLYDGLVTAAFTMIKGFIGRGTLSFVV